jgi:hypothetical protein
MVADAAVLSIDNARVTRETSSKKMSVIWILFYNKGMKRRKYLAKGQM